MDASLAEKLAFRCGFQHAAPLDARALRFLPAVRAMCGANRCGKYGTCWTCPPACGSLAEMEARARRYRAGLLVQAEGRLEDPFDLPGMRRTERRFKRAFEKLCGLLREQSPGLLPLGAGGCTVCRVCAYPSAPCRFPGRAFVSMEAAGLDVAEVCGTCGLRYNYGPGSIAFTGCFLFD